METIYQKFLGDTVSPIIDFKTYFQNFRTELNKVCSLEFKNCDTAFSNFISFSEEQEDILAHTCSIEKLDPEITYEKLDTEIMLTRPELYEKLPVPENCELNTIKNIRNRTEVEHEQILQLCKYRGQKFVISDEHKSDKPDLFPGKEVIFTILIFLPFHHLTKDSSRFNKMTHRGLKNSQELMVLGSQTFDVLRDAVLCVEDFNDTQGDISEDPFKEDNIHQTGDKYKSAMFYFGNNFYIDTRDPSNIDYSCCIKEFGERHGIKFGDTFPMEKSRFIDLAIKLGYPYVYQHQGNCEHLIVFKSARFIHWNDVLVSSLYPVHITLTPTRSHFCNVCGRWIAKWCVREYERLPNDPSYLCKECFKSYCYIDGKKVGHFKAYKYCDSKALL